MKLLTGIFQKNQGVDRVFAFGFGVKALSCALGIWGLVGCQSVSGSRFEAVPVGTDTAKKTALQMDLSSRHEYRLKNGLRVIIKEDHRSPVVMTQLWYQVGSADEPKGKGGISHLLEHLMFKGTEAISSEDFERLVAKFGGSNNAFTSYDYTGYYEVFPANHWQLALELEADRMKNLRFDAKAFAKEHQVVMEERRQRTDDNPIAKAYEKFRQLALPNSPKRSPVIGQMHELERIDLPSLKHWYRDWYAPNNATLVIVGDVKAEEALQAVKRYFADLPPSDLPRRQSLQQPAFRGYQQQSDQQAVQVPMLFMGYNVPTLTSTTDTKTPYALSLLQSILDGGLSARLESRLVREKNLLAAVGTSYDPFEKGDELFLIQATPREGVSLKQAENALIQEIENLAKEPILPAEIKRAKTKTLADLIYAQDSISGQAQMIGSLQSVGLDDRLIADLPKQFDQISPADLQTIAKKYLDRQNLTVLFVEPKTDKTD